MNDNKFTDQELDVCRNTDMAALAESLGYTVTRHNKWQTLKEAQHIVIKNGTQYYDNYKREWGDAVTFLRDYGNMDFVQAVEYLLKHTRELEDMDIPEDEQEAAAMEAVEREILRKQENKKRKVDEKTRIAKLFCAAFENSVLLKPTVENVETWIERSGILPHQLEGMVRDAERIAESYLQIAEIIKHKIKSRDWRDEDGSKKEEPVSNSGEDGDIDDPAEELSDIIGEDD